MQKTFTVKLTADEISVIESLLQYEAEFYSNSDDDTDVAAYNICDSVINKLLNAEEG